MKNRCLAVTRRLLLAAVLLASTAPLAAGSARLDAGNPPIAEPVSRTGLVRTERLSARRPRLQTRPVWRALLLVYRGIDADYTDSTGAPRHLTTTLPEEEVLTAIYDFEQLPSTANDYSDGEAWVEYDVVQVDRPLTSVTICGTNLYWPSPSDVRPELDAYAPPGTYDSVFVHWPQTDFATGEQIPSPGWGLAILGTSWSNGATYATVANAPLWMWDEPRAGEVWVHEWLHGVCSYYASQGYPMPAGDADGGSGHGYVWSPTTGWGEYYRDLMTGRVRDNGAWTGITARAWRDGSILGEEETLFADYFNANTTGRYEQVGIAQWEAATLDLSIGSDLLSDNAIYAPIRTDQSLLVQGRAFIPPDSEVGLYDSVAVAVRNESDEYWATLAYGSALYEQDHISIMHNGAWGQLYPLPLPTGWYTVELLVGYETGTLSMRAWADGTDQPDWQTSASLPEGWHAADVGFRHFGLPTGVDDLYVECQP